jgi:6-phosphogluconolactonase (cycloisomerase 2 family)
MRIVTIAAVASLTLAACADGRPSPTEARTVSDIALSTGGHGHEADVGGVFTSTNGASGNTVVAFARSADGSLQLQGTYPTGGLGIGGVTDPLVSQYALVLSHDKKLLFVVNAGSDDISTFQVRKHGLELVGTFPSGGVLPTSLTVSHDAVYVLNAGSNTVAMLRIGRGGRLHPVAGGTRSLSPGAAGGAAIRISPDGRFVTVTERASNTIDTYVVGHDGMLSMPTVSASAGAAPFGFDYTPRGRILVSEAASGSASSYVRNRDGSLTVVSGVVSTEGQRAPCWLIATSDGRFAYTANAGTGTISGFAVDSDGRMTLLTPGGATGISGQGSTPLDLDVTRDNRFLYVFENGTGTVGGFRINRDGSLTELPDTPGLVARAGYQGLAAY